MDSSSSKDTVFAPSSKEVAPATEVPSESYRCPERMFAAVMNMRRLSETRRVARIQSKSRKV